MEDRDHNWQSSVRKRRKQEDKVGHSEDRIKLKTHKSTVHKSPQLHCNMSLGLDSHRTAECHPNGKNSNAEQSGPKACTAEKPPIPHRKHMGPRHFGSVMGQSPDHKSFDGHFGEASNNLPRQASEGFIEKNMQIHTLSHTGWLKGSVGDIKAAAKTVADSKAWPEDTIPRCATASPEREADAMPQRPIPYNMGLLHSYFAQIHGITSHMQTWSYAMQSWWQRCCDEIRKQHSMISEELLEDERRWIALQKYAEEQRHVLDIVSSISKSKR
mmetsp:Transcript_17271/g.41248  ORF Transcript_17271/g.41248 Transcript_17271/m.41248 type:complete len:271 (+) Transcript_17271:305-1117(+)